MRDRLIELLLESEMEADNKGFCNCYSSKFKAECVANYLIENGVVVPPCKVGDLLFCIITDGFMDKRYKHIEACRVSDILISSSGNFVYGVREINKHYGHSAVLWENAFKTFEEAERALKGGAGQ